jgi:hypothetical protein
MTVRGQISISLQIKILTWQRGMLTSSLLLIQAVEYFQRVISLQEDNGEVWSALGTSAQLHPFTLLLAWKLTTLLRPLLSYAG